MRDKTKILITGGTGLIGTAMSKMFLEQGFNVAVLTRKKPANPQKNIVYYEWNTENGFIERGALDSADYIIHLSGSSLGEGRWTKKRKKKILESRLNPAGLLFSELERSGNKIKAFISSSAIGYYGSLTSEKIFTESDPPGNDFLGKVCVEWENSAERFAEISERVVLIRTGIVLSVKGGTLKRLLPLFKIGVGVPLGSGRQYFPWIHIDDIISIYKMALENSTMEGAYNGVSPEHTDNIGFTRALNNYLGKKTWLPNLPSLFLRIAFGEMADVILKGSRVSCSKLLDQGFEFKFNSLDHALSDILDNQ